MLVHEKRTGEEWSLPLELELSPPFTLPGPEWDFEDEREGVLSARNRITGEVRFADPHSQWFIHLPELEETDFKPTSNLASRHTGNWDLVAPGNDKDFEFTPETDDERETLIKYGFTITERKREQS
jgi:hypothetical protein